MGIAYAEDIATTVAKGTGVIKEKVLASSDWAHLAVAASTTIATSTIAAGATSGTAAASVATGAVMTFWRANTDNGAATPEVRVNLGGGGTSISWTDALVAPNGTYQVGDHIGIGAFVKATTTRGAQMVVDFADSAITARILTYAVYRTHDGTTGVDKLTRWFYWNASVGATSDKLYITVSAGKEHLYVSVEGPKAGETNAYNATYGSTRQCMALCDINPYFSVTYDNTPAVAFIGNNNQSQINYGSSNQLVSRQIYVSRSADNLSSWAVAHLRSLAHMGSGTDYARTYQPVGLDGALVMLPFVVFEDAKGIRGSLSRIFHGGGSASTPSASNDPVFWVPGMEETYGGITYRSIIPFRSGTTGNTYCCYGFPGTWNNGIGAQPGPIIFVPKA